SSVVSRMAGNVERGMNRTENAQRRLGAVTDRSSAQWEQNGRAMELAGRGFISTGTILSGLLSAGIVTATKTASDMEDAFSAVMRLIACAMELAGRWFISEVSIVSGLLSAGIVTATKTASDM